MDMTQGVLFVHSAPRALCPHIEWAAGGAIGAQARFDWTPQPAAPGLVRAEVCWRAPAGSGSRIADDHYGDEDAFLDAWVEVMRPEYEAMLVTVYPHSPPRWRVNGTASATPEFAKAFRCKVGAKMRPANQCVVW